MLRSLLFPVRGWTVAVLAVAAVASTPAPATAGCGDYVVIRDATGDVYFTIGDPDSMIAYWRQ